MLISEAFNLYREAEIVAAGLSKKTFESYIYAEKHAVKYFGDSKINLLTPLDVREFYKHLLTWQKPDSARNNIVCLRSVVKLCNRYEKMSICPEDIKIPKREKRITKCLDAKQVEQFIEILAQNRRGYAKVNRLRNVAMAEVLYTSGIRVSELCRLNRNSINNRQFVVIGKSKNPRVCFISQEAEQRLTEYLATRADANPALFISNENGERVKPGGVRRVFRQACHRSDFEGIHPHTMRHSFATTLLSNGVDITYIAEMMGHTSIETTRVYQHFENPRLREMHQKCFV